MIDRTIRFCLEKKLVVSLVLIAICLYGFMVMPFPVDVGLPRDPVPVDAIPDIGENQQIVFTEWMGRSPQDVEDQVTYPLTVSLLGVPGVKTVRSTSMFGFSSIYVIFEDKVDFYWSRSRVLEKLASTKNVLPTGVSPVLGPDATPLGQVFWYTVEGEGFDLFELRSIQDWTVRYGLQSVPGISEVGSVGGFVKEYQIDLDPEAMRIYGFSLMEVVEAVRRSNLDVGAKTLEINRVEYVIRGLGFLKSVDDLKNSVIRAVNGVPVTLGQLGHVSLGPASRRGALDKEGAEVVGGVAVVRFGANPLDVIERLKAKIKEIAPGLPKRTLADGRESQVKIVPFYDRTILINETLGTLKEALTQQILVTIVVVIFTVFHLGSSILISGLLPIAVLMTFIGMKTFGVDSNLTSLAGIAIAIGTMVDMGIVLSENILKHIDRASPDEPIVEVIFRAASEVGSAVMTAVSTTVVGFLPVFAMVGPEGKMFKPLAYTKTFALISSLIVALTLLPVAAQFLIARKAGGAPRSTFWPGLLLVALGMYLLSSKPLIGVLFLLAGILVLIWRRLSQKVQDFGEAGGNVLALVLVGVFLTDSWMPLGVGRGIAPNLVFVVVICGGLLCSFALFQKYYGSLLKHFLRRKLLFMAFPCLVVLFGLTIWQGFGTIAGWVPGLVEKTGMSADFLLKSRFWTWGVHAFPGLGKEFLPPLDEGSYLLMPTTMPHASIGECLDVLSKQNLAIRAIPEVESVVGKIGRVDSPLDPAPISMIETIISYHPEFGPVDPETGQRKRFWREQIKKPDDIWKEIVKAASLPGTTAAPRLQPIAARIVMLQTGIRASMGVQIQGQTLGQIETLGKDVERLIKEVPGVEPAAVVSDRVVGKPYIEIAIDRVSAARNGARIQDIQDVIEVALGGKPLAFTVEGRERYPVRLRFARELRGDIESLGRILVPVPGGTHVPLGQLAEIKFTKGPQAIKSENTLLVSYVIFDKKPGFGETDVVEAASAHLNLAIAEGRLKLPAGSSFRFIGSYQNQVRSEKTMMVVVPLSLLIIFIILYLEFNRISTTAMVFSGIGVAFCGGFIMIWLYGQPWFMNVSLFGIHFRELFNMHPMNLSVAVWVGFIALFGIASDDGVVMSTYLDQVFAERNPQTVEEIREATLQAGLMRIRPCLMTTATTILALLPVLTSTGRGADVMIPMAIPTFGGMAVELLTLFVVPVGYCFFKERELSRSANPETVLKK